MQQLYYLAFQVALDRTVYKIGITKNSVKSRYRGCNTPYKVLWVVTPEDAELSVRVLERAVVNRFRFERCEDAPVDGLANTELFDVDVLPTIEDGLAFLALAGITAAPYVEAVNSTVPKIPSPCHPKPSQLQVVKSVPVVAATAPASVSADYDCSDDDDQDYPEDPSSPYFMWAPIDHFRLTTGWPYDKIASRVAKRVMKLLESRVDDSNTIV